MPVAPTTMHASRPSISSKNPRFIWAAEFMTTTVFEKACPAHVRRSSSSVEMSRYVRLSSMPASVSEASKRPLYCTFGGSVPSPETRPKTIMAVSEYSVMLSRSGSV